MDWPFENDADIVRDLISRANKGDASAGAELLRCVRAGIDARMIAAAAPEYELALKYLAAALTIYLDGGVKIERALGVEEIGSPGRPADAGNPLKTQYAALMLLMMRRRRCSADAAQNRILEVFEREDPAAGSRSPISKRSLQQIYADHAPMRDIDDDPDHPERFEDLLLSFIADPRLRKKLPEFFAKT